MNLSKLVTVIILFSLLIVSLLLSSCGDDSSVSPSGTQEITIGALLSLTGDWSSLEWNPIADMRLSDKDENGSRTMNTHLHIIEPYTNLYRVWKTPELEKSIRNLLDIFTDKLLNKETYHLDLFFDDEWEGKRNIRAMVMILRRRKQPRNRAGFRR